MDVEVEKDARMRLHCRAVELWRVSLGRPLSDAERAQYNAAEEALNPQLPRGFAEAYLGRGIDFKDMAAFEAQRARWKAQKQRRPR